MINLKQWTVEIFPLTSEKKIQRKWKNLRVCFKRELDAQNNATSGEGRRKLRQYLYFGQLSFLLTHSEDCAKRSNLSTQSNENEEEANSSQEEESELPRNVRQKKQTTISYEESLLQILRQKKIEDIDVDEEK
jgi:hypothetical protein